MVESPLLVATRSVGKQQEIRVLLADIPYRVIFPDEAGLAPHRDEEGLEDAGSFSGNAIRKAEYFARRSRLPTVAEDSGIEVFALGGAPGVRSKRFAMPSDDQDAANNRELLRRLAGAPPERRRARYRCAVACVAKPSAVPVIFEGSCVGSILEAPRGSGGFGYDPLFLSADLQRTFAEVDVDEKHAVSHRGEAFRKFVEWLAHHPV